MEFRIGQGYDVHRLAMGETLWLGGVLIPHNKGTVAHSDGDVLIHAICDALLGALKLGDIGTHFPDIDAKYKNIDSKVLLQKSYELVKEMGYELVNLDSTISAQKPRLNPFIPEMERTMAAILGVNVSCISVKATTTEQLGFEGREEGISVSAVALLKST